MQLLRMSNSETRNGNWWWRNILGGTIVIYIILIILAPLWSQKDDERNIVAFPGRLETPDIILVSLGFLFNSGIIERLRKLQVSATEVSAELDAAKSEVQTAQKGLEIVEQKIATLSPDAALNQEKAQIKEVKNVLASSDLRIERVQNYIKKY